MRRGDGEWAPKQSVGESEGGGAGADGEAERKDCGGGGDFVVGEAAQAVGGVGAQGIEPYDDACVVRLVAQLQWRAECAACFVGVAAGFEGFVEVSEQLFVDLAVQLLGAKHIRNSPHPAHVNLRCRASKDFPGAAPFSSQKGARYRCNCYRNFRSNVFVSPRTLLK